jgi:RluA family pseudouridine synthase
MKNNRIRLHKYVKEYLASINNTDYTSPEIQRNIENYGVSVDGVFYRNRLQWVYPHQTLIVDWPARNHGDIEEIKILIDTQDYMVIFKPPGLVVQSGAGHQVINLVNWLLQNYPEQSDFDSEIYPTRGLVHRLDKLTQGILIVAKNMETLEFFQNQFRERKVIKKYLAVVDGVMINSVHIKNYQARSKSNPTKNIIIWDKEDALKYSDKSKFAESIFTPLFFSRESDKTLVEVQIFTGRMHQIRLQAQSLNHSLIADPKYPKIQAGIPKEFIQITNDFETGIFRTEQDNIYNLSKKEFEELQKSIFGEVEFCLLSNYIKLQSPKGEVIEIQKYNA